MVAELGGLLSLHCLHSQGKFFNTAPARPPSAAIGALRSSLPALKPSELAFLCFPVKVLGLIYAVPQPARGWARYHHVNTLRDCLTPAFTIRPAPLYCPGEVQCPFFSRLQHTVRVRPSYTQPLDIPMIPAGFPKQGHPQIL